MRMPLTQVTNRSSAIAPHPLCDFRVTLRKPLERVPRPQIAAGREGRVDKVQVPGSNLAEKQTAGLGITTQPLDVLLEHIEDLVVEIHQDSLVRR